MHDIEIFANIRCADILQLIWLIVDTDTNIYAYFCFATPNCRNQQVSSVVEFTYSIMMHTLTVSKLCNIHFLCKRRKI